MSTPPLLSIVSPVYRAENIVEELVLQLTQELTSMGVLYEIILVDDRSPDGSWGAVCGACSRDPRVKGVRLSRNFGQHYAISAGLSLAQGEWVVVMDCDLQDRPDQIGRLYDQALHSGAKIVLARRRARTDGFFKRLSSQLFHVAFRFLSGMKTDSSVANFGIYHRLVIDQVNKMGEVARSFPSLIENLGFTRTFLDVPHAERHEGSSSYTLAKLIKLTLDVCISNTNKPLHFTVKLGFIMSLASVFLALYNLVAHWCGVITVAGFTSTMFSIWFVGGLMMFTMGFLGLYIGKIFEQVKGRPLFVIEERVNIE